MAMSSKSQDFKTVVYLQKLSRIHEGIFGIGTGVGMIGWLTRETQYMLWSCSAIPGGGEKIAIGYFQIGNCLFNCLLLATSCSNSENKYGGKIKSFLRFCQISFWRVFKHYLFLLADPHSPWFFQVLLRFRTFPIVLRSHIYRNCLYKSWLNPDDNDFMRIL